MGCPPVGHGLGLPAITTGVPEQEDEETTTAGIITAKLDGSTTVEATDLLAPGEEPPLCESIADIVKFQIENGLIDEDDAEDLIEALVDSQVKAGRITEDEAEDLEECVEDALDDDEVDDDEVDDDEVDDDEVDDD